MRIDERHAGKASDRTNKTKDKETSERGGAIADLDDIYKEAGDWKVNLGEEKIHATRLPGRFRRIKWFTASLYLLYFMGPYIRWNGRQAILFDIPGRKYHIFGATIWPQDIWMLALLLISFFIGLYAITAMAGRVFCGYFCWQTVWTDVYTWIEEKLEGPPAKRRTLDRAPWSFHKLRIKTVKHALWLLLSALTGITFTAYFIDSFELWRRYFYLEGPIYIWVTPLPFLIGSYIGVGFMREQICFWLCPYARIQGVMTDSETIMPTYDIRRGEPRMKLKRAGKEDVIAGDCVDCGLCVAVCPTGVDIRDGQQEGCITCALCVDACDSIMEKVGRPKGLIRYMSLKDMLGEKTPPFYRRPRILAYWLSLALAATLVIYGFTSSSPMSLTVLHERQPLYTLLSTGEMQNKYTLKIVNRTGRSLDVKISIDADKGFELRSPVEAVKVKTGKVASVAAFVVSSPGAGVSGRAPVRFIVYDVDDREISAWYESFFAGPGTDERL